MMAAWYALGSIKAKAVFLDILDDRKPPRSTLTIRTLRDRQQSQAISANLPFRRDPEHSREWPGKTLVRFLSLDCIGISV